MVVTDWWSAQGHPVNEEGRRAATALLVESGYHAGNASLVVHVVAREIENDEPERALKYLRSFIGRHETLVLRTCAVLCTQEAESSPAESRATDTDPSGALGPERAVTPPE